MNDLSRRRRGTTPRPLSRSLAILLTLMLLMFNRAFAGLTQQYCSSENTADTESSDSVWQSLGLCKTTCQNSYALAVVQGSSCWCSNYLPADTTSVSNCDIKCQGYPYEYCGNSGAGLYGYMILNQAAISGTLGASSSSAASTDSSGSSQTQSSDTSSTQGSSTSATQTTYGPLTSRTSSPTWTPSPVTTVQVLTISNTPVTHTVTSMPTVASGGDESSTSKVQSKGVSGGLIAGVVVATVAGMLCIGAILFWCWRRRRLTEAEAEAGTGMPGAGNRPTRNISVLSKQGLLEKVYPSAVMTQRSHANSQSPSFNTTPGNEASGGVSPISERRNSRPLFYDQRLNPTALMDIDNVSRVSVNTLPDNRDFSRTLNVTNPDPDGWD